MNLYKIMLVDDEEEVRRGIIEKMDWEGLGFQIIGDAENGEDALEKIENLEPDILITDIRMPYMDGLSLIERVRKKFPSIKTIIFSGFNEFDYAKEAIRLGVTQYILKPVNMEELGEILSRLRETLDKEIEARRDIDMLRQNYQASLPILRQQFLNHLVSGKANPEETEEKLERYGIDIGDSALRSVAVIDIEDEFLKEEGLEIDKELIPIFVQNFIEEKLKLSHRYCIFNALSELRFIIICAFDEIGGDSEFSDTLRDICRESRRILGIELTIGIGSAYPELARLETSYNEALNAIGYKDIVGRGDTVYINDVEPVMPGTLKLGEKEEKDFIYAIKFGTTQALKEVCEEIIERMENAKVHSRQYQAYMLSIMNTLVQLMQQYEIRLEMMDQGAADYLELLGIIKNTDFFCAWFRDACLRLHQYLREKRENTTKTIIEEAKLYISENFTNPDLSLEMICKHLHMSTAYFSTIFKKETKQTYVAYLTDLRMNMALELLNTTDKKTYMISEEVGYPEQNYFSYVFKKKFGISPSKYRSRDKKR